jgi:hypothetical protein
MVKLIALFLQLSASQAPSVVSSCEWVGPRLDGVSVKVCSGSVEAFRDASGQVQEYVTR